MKNKANWTFSDYVEQVISLSAISEVPGIDEARAELIKEMWALYPVECKELGLTDGA